MTKADLVEEIAVATGISRITRPSSLDGLLDSVCRALE